MYLSSHFSASLDVFFFSVRHSERKTPKDYNFIMVQNGSITVAYDDEQHLFSRGDILLLEPGKTYIFNNYSNNFCLNIQCSRNFIERLIPPGSVIECNSTLGRKNDYRRLAVVLSDIAVIYSQENNEIPMTARLFDLMDVLLRVHIRKNPTGASDVNTRRVSEIQSYIQHNYHHALSLQELADTMYLSPQYLSKFIKQNMGITFVHYLNNVRLQHAYEELLGTDHSVTEIAFNNGFSNTAAFNKSFREVYHESPSAHRLHKNAEKPEKEEPFGSVFSGMPLPQANPADVSEEIHLFADQTQSYYPSWSDTINIGRLSNALEQHFHRAFTRFQHKTHFRYVRFDNIFSPECMRPLENGKGFDYSNLNMALDFFHEINIMPFIELSFKPHKKDLVNYRQTTYEESFEPEEDEEWYLFALRDLLCHCINRYGYACVSKWRFEIWQKHDENLNYPVSAADYMKKFCAYRAIIKELLPDCPVGGPGYNTSAQKIHFLEILEEMKRQEVYPDFFSLYIYCHSPKQYEFKTTEERQHSILSPDPDLPMQLFSSYEESIRSIIPGQIPIYVTEFNSGISGNNYISASAFQSAFIARMSLALFEKTPCIGYWHFSDEARQFSANPQVYSTDLGLLDTHGIPKASLYAYFLLATLNRKLIACGSNYIATTNERNQYQILAFNYVHYSHYHCMNFTMPMHLQNTYDAFDSGANHTMKFTLNGIPTGRYKVLKTTLNREHGSLLDEFIRIFNDGYLTSNELYAMILNMQENEVDYYVHSVRPQQRIRYLEVDTDQVMHLECTMQPHEIMVFEVTRRE